MEVPAYNVGKIFNNLIQGILPESLASQGRCVPLAKSGGSFAAGAVSSNGGREVREETRGRRTVRAMF